MLITPSVPTITENINFPAAIIYNLLLDRHFTSVIM